MGRAYYEIDQDRLQEIVEKYLPKGWRIRINPKYLDTIEAESSHVWGLAYERSKIIYLRCLHNLDDLWTFLHECGHVRLGHFRRQVPAHIEEWQADLYAHEIFLDEDLPIMPRLLAHAKYRVCEEIQLDKLKGIEINPAAREWSLL